MSAVEGLTLIDGKIYGYRYKLARAEGSDTGWREAYRRTGVSVFCVDAESGEETILYEISA